jgi:Mrp family chromosome partitioning ATPase/intein/homing endonuclease
MGEQQEHGHQHEQQGMHPSFLRVIQQKQRVKEKLSKIKHKIGVYSAKGGVGKTTIAVNLAYALKQKGFKVGLLDADIDCPNVTMFLGMEDVKMEPVLPLKPIDKDGVKVASTAMLVDEMKRPIIWRGPIIVKMLGDFFENTDWGELDYLIIDLSPGCLPAGTFVLMANNYPKPIEKIKPGEFVLSYDNGRLVPSKVISIISQGEQEVFKLKTPNRTIIASGNHPFLKYHRNYYWQQLRNLSPENRLIVLGCIDRGKPLKLPHFEESVHNTNTHITLPEYTSPEFMQIIGHFIGDGYIRINKTRNLIIGIRVCEPSGSKFRSTYESLYRSVFTNCNIFPDGDNTFAIDSLPLVKLFEHLDLYHKAKEKQVPEWVFSLPLDQRQAFIKGYAEADGHIRHRESTKTMHDKSGQLQLVKIVHDVVSLESTNELLIRQMHELCQISGMRSGNVRMRNKSGNVFSDGHAIGPSSNYTFEYSQKIDTAPFKIARVKAVEPAGYRETFDLQLDGSHNFIANNMIVHNTSDAPLTIMQVLELDGFVIVTTPQRIAGINSIRSGMMAKRLGVPLIGVVENMSEGKPSKSTEEVVNVLQTELLGTVRKDSSIADMTDSGKVHVMNDPTTRSEFEAIIKKICA